MFSRPLRHNSFMTNIFKELKNGYQGRHRTIEVMIKQANCSRYIETKRLALVEKKNNTNQYFFFFLYTICKKMFLPCIQYKFIYHCININSHNELVPNYVGTKMEV